MLIYEIARYIVKIPHGYTLSCTFSSGNRFIDVILEGKRGLIVQKFELDSETPTEVPVSTCLQKK
jgi:hypothetical protein